MKRLAQGLVFACLLLRFELSAELLKGDGAHFVKVSELLPFQSKRDRFIAVLDCLVHLFQFNRGLGMLQKVVAVVWTD